MGKRKGFYAVAVGRNPGIYLTWEETKDQVHQYPGAVFKGFQSRSEALEFINQKSLPAPPQQPCPSPREYSPRSTLPRSDPLDSDELVVCDLPGLQQGRSLKRPYSEISDLDCYLPLKAEHFPTTNSKPLATLLNHVSGPAPPLPPSRCLFLELPQNLIVKIAEECPEDTQFALEKVSKELSVVINRKVFGLTEKQMKVKDYVKAKKNVFFTGSAGTGKSFLLIHLVKYLRSLFPIEQEFLANVAITAPSGIAACNIGGQTIYRWAGIQRGQDAKEMGKAWRTDKRSIWRSTQILIIDEISFLCCTLFHRLEQFARVVRNNERPFGGIQIILAGDFLQLPPVKKPIPNTFYTQLLEAPPPRTQEQKNQREFDLLEWNYRNKEFAFEADCWRDVIGDHMVLLDEVFRQKDSHFVRILQEIRLGRCSPEVLKVLQSTRDNVLDEQNSIKIFNTNSRVDHHNNKELQKLTTPPQTFTAFDCIKKYWEEGELDPITDRERTHELYEQLDGFLATPEVLLKENCKVILLFNIDEDHFNGLVGNVVGWKEVTRKDFGYKKKYLRWCMSNYQIPLVKFNDEVIAVGPRAFKAKLSFGKACRIQIPLKLAYAITTHKCQGMQINSAEVSIDDCFSHGQAYVALSRVRGLNGLKINAIRSSKISASPIALTFYNDGDL